MNDLIDTKHLGSWNIHLLLRCFFDMSQLEAPYGSIIICYGGYGLIKSSPLGAVYEREKPDIPRKIYLEYEYIEENTTSRWGCKRSSNKQKKWFLHRGALDDYYYSRVKEAEIRDDIRILVNEIKKIESKI